MVSGYEENFARKNRIGNAGDIEDVKTNVCTSIAEDVMSDAGVR